MNTEQILTYFRECWDKVEKLAVKEGLENAFYPIIIQERDDPRSINSTLPALSAEYAKLVRARITNPTASGFEGLILDEKTLTELEPNVEVVDVIYLKCNGVYSIQCVKECPDRSSERSPLHRYIAVGLQQPSAVTEDKLQKAYNDLESLLN